MDSVAEGVSTTRATWNIAQQLEIEMPITEKIYQVLYQGIDPRQAAAELMEAEVEVPTFDGKTNLGIPAGSQTGKVFRLKGKGIPHLHRNGRGDQLVTLVVVTPEKLTDKQHQLFQELAKSFGSADVPRQKRRGLFR